MRVVKIETQVQQKRYVVIDEEGMLVEPIVRYLKYLDRIGAARNALRSYATVLKQYWEYLSQQQLDWQQITLDDLARLFSGSSSPQAHYTFFLLIQFHRRIPTGRSTML